MSTDSVRVAGGRVRPRKAQLEARAAAPVAPALDVLSHEARVRGERVGDPPRRYPEAVTDGDTRQVLRCHSHADGGLDTWRQAVRHSQPVILSGSPLLGDTSSKFVADHKPGVRHTWTWDHLSDVCAADAAGVGKRGQPEWGCFISAPGKDRFYICDPDKNAFGSFYHVREPETERKTLTFADFAACARKWRTRKVLLRAALDYPQALAHPRATLPADWGGDVSQPSLRDTAPGLHAELDALVDWAWLLKAVQEPCRFGGVLHTTLAACSPGGLQPAKFVTFDTLLCQVRGRSRVLLVGPGHTYAGMYPYPVAHPYDGYSMVDFDAPDVGQWPRFVAVWGQATILGPGDVVFIPRGWWAHIQAMPDQEEGQPAAPGQGEEVTWLEVELHRGARARVAEAVAPYVGRVVEELAVECEGVAGARGWLRSIGGGTERQVVDLATPQGYKRIRSATAIRDEVLLTIGDGANVAAFLEALTEGRMTPTPWLNAHYREPLYLKDKPVVVADTRTEWELRFPQLFAKKLQLEGYDVASTPVSVLNPAHPQFLGAGSKAAAA